MGRSTTALERRRAQDRERWRKRYADPEKKEKYLKRRQVKYFEDLEANQRRSRDRYYADKDNCNERRKRNAQTNRERENARHRKYYQEHKEHLSKIIYAARIRRDPTNGLHTAINRYKKGDIGFDELVKIYEQRIVQLDERLEQSSGRSKSDAAPGSGSSEDGGRSS